jgi:imidazolonepropionase-like amidohydrolase
MRRICAVGALAFGLVGAGLRAEEGAGAAKFEIVRIPDDPYPSTYRPAAAPPTLIRGATIYDGRGGEFTSSDLLVINGRIARIGQRLGAPGAQVVDAAGRYVTPGIIDMHSHLGDYPSPSVRAHSDGNEATRPATPEVWAEHSVWPQDPGFSRALAAGVTVIQVLPGSANLFGGRSAILKNVPARTVQGMKFPGAHYGLKMACGENPKRVYGEKGGPSTRMGNMAGYRAQWIKATKYRKDWDEYWVKAEAYKAKLARGRVMEGDKEAEPPKAPDRDLGLDTLADVLRGKIHVQMHCYRADEMAQILDMAREFNYRIAAFHHAVEAYKIADLLAKEHVCAAMWADWWGFKLEAWDSVQENIALVHNAGACAAIHSDSEVGIQRLNQEVAKALANARRAGLKISDAEAWQWLTLNPAKAIGIDQETGSLEPGKAADVIVWSGNPFSVYSHPDRVYIDGALMYDRADPRYQPVSDFELGTPTAPRGAHP